MDAEPEEVIKKMKTINPEHNDLVIKDKQDKNALEDAWGKESEKRMLELEESKSETIPSEQVHQYVYNQLKAVKGKF